MRARERNYDSNNNNIIELRGDWCGIVNTSDLPQRFDTDEFTYGVIGPGPIVLYILIVINSSFEM